MRTLYENKRKRKKEKTAKKQQTTNNNHKRKNAFYVRISLKILLLLPHNTIIIKNKWETIKYIVGVFSSTPPLSILFFVELLDFFFEVPAMENLPNQSPSADERESPIDIYDIDRWQRDLQSTFKDQSASFDLPETVKYPKVNEFRFFTWSNIVSFFSMYMNLHPYYSLITIDMNYFTL